MRNGPHQTVTTRMKHKHDSNQASAVRKTNGSLLIALNRQALIYRDDAM